MTTHKFVAAVCGRRYDEITVLWERLLKFENGDGH